MVAHLVKAFKRLFGTFSSRLGVAALIVVMACVPVFEMVVIRLFSELITEGPQKLDTDPAQIVWDVALFFTAFAAARTMHHVLRVMRVRVFRNRFDESEANRSPSQESWDWALAFELSNILFSLVQIVAFSALFFYLDPITGTVNVVASAIVLSIVSWLYKNQLGLQREYATMGSRPGTVAISERVSGRIVSGEIGSALASAGFVLVLVIMLVRTLYGEMTAADAIVVFLALRLLYGQVGSLSSAIMRFARAMARSEI